MQKVDLGKLCTKIAEEHSINKQVSIVIDARLPVVYFDETALTQVVTNLVSNAINHNDKSLCEIRVSSIDRGSHYEISVSDNGPGVPEEHKDKIFNLFENRNSRCSASTGIGLAIVKRIIDGSNGNIWVRSGEETGLTVTFTIQKEER